MRVSSDFIGGLLRPPAPKPKLPTARERAAANRLNVLRAVAEHGSLRCSDLAAACWPAATFGEQMAQRTVRALVAAGELMPRRNALGGVSFVLNSGVRGAIAPPTRRHRGGFADPANGRIASAGAGSWRIAG